MVRDAIVGRYLFRERGSLSGRDVLPLLLRHGRNEYGGGDGDGDDDENTRYSTLGSLACP